MASRPTGRAKTDLLATIEISESEMQLLSSTVLIARLVDGGVSPLTAERYVAIQQGTAQSGRARRHALSRH